TASGAWAGTPITGNVTGCSVTGALTAKPGVPIGGTVPGVPVAKTYKQGLALTGTLTGCGGAQTGTKGGLQIDSGSFKAKIKLPFTVKVCANGTNDGTDCTKLGDAACTGGGTCGPNYYPNCLGIVGGGLFLSPSFAPIAKVKWTATVA